MNKPTMQAMVEKHLAVARDASKHFMKIGKKETSTFIKHQVIIIDEEVKLKSTITLLPIRRMYNYGDKIVDDEYLTYEMEEDVEV